MRPKSTNTETFADERFVNLVRRASKLGLGVWLPHISRRGVGLEALAKGDVVLEQDLQLSLLGADSARIVRATPVAWVWEERGSSDRSAQTERASEGEAVIAAGCCVRRKKAPKRKPAKKKKPMRLRERGMA